MGPTSLAALRAAAPVTLLPNGIRLTVASGWIIDGEDRLSSTTILRLVECVREYHWLRDVQAHAWGRGADSICRRLESDFLHTIAAGEEITLTYTVQWVGRRSYTLRVLVANRQQIPCAQCVLVLVFYDARARASQMPDREVAAQLTALAGQGV
jgi:acyl-CoA thioesterase FadM